MIKTTRKIATVLVMSMVMSAVPQCMPADMGMVKVEAATKKSTKVKYTLKNGVLTIKGKGKMPKSMTFKNNKKIKKVVIKKGVTSISDYAFSKCTNLKSVEISKTVKEIGKKAFYKTSIKKVTIPKKVKLIGNDAFASCKKLKKMTVPGDFKIKKEKTDEVYFLNAKTKVDTIKFNTSLNLDTVAYLYTNNFDVSSKDKLFTDIDGVIYSKNKKEIVRVPSARTELVVAKECEVFCTNSVYYANFGYDEDPIGGCANLKKVVLPENVKEIDNEKYFAVVKANSYNTYIKNWEIKNKNIKCLDKLMIDVWDRDIELKDFYNKFSDLYTVSNGMYIGNDGTLLCFTTRKANVTLPKEVNRIGKYAFREGDLHYITLPEGLQEIDDYAFNGRVIQEITMPSTVKRIGKGAFLQCEELSQVVLNEGLVEIDSLAFGTCKSLKEVVIPNSVVSLGKEAFKDSGIEEVQLSKNIKEISEGAFRNTKLTKIDIPASVKVINKNAFKKTRITSIILPESVETIKKGAFSKCYNLESVTIKNKNVKIDKTAFKYSDKVVVNGK